MKNKYFAWSMLVAISAIAASGIAGCGAKEEPLTEKLPAKVNRSDGPSAGGAVAAPAPAEAAAKAGT